MHLFMQEFILRAIYKEVKLIFKFYVYKDHFLGCRMNVGLNETHNHCVSEV